jgi:hypothetical protein
MVQRLLYLYNFRCTVYVYRGSAWFMCTACVQEGCHLSWTCDLDMLMRETDVESALTGGSSSRAVSSLVLPKRYSVAQQSISSSVVMCLQATLIKP